VTVDKVVHLNLIGLNGNAFALLGAFQKQAHKECWSKEEIDSVINEATSSDYNHLLVTLMNHCE
jgi:hypothetical protein